MIQEKLSDKFELLDVHENLVEAGFRIEDLRTPCFLVDREIVRRNCCKMLETCKRLGLKLRHQTKTHKTLEAALMATADTRRCIVVSTLAEAEFYDENWFDDIAYGYPLTPEKIPRCFKLLRKLQEFHVFVDNPAIVDRLHEHFFQQPPHFQTIPWSIFIKVDCGYGRAGVPWDEHDSLLSLAKKIHGSNFAVLRGLYAHCGNSYKTTNADAIVDVASAATSRMLEVVQKLKAATIPCECFGIGSTPSCSSDDAVQSMQGLTEMHPGNYVFYDAQQFTLGSCTLDEIGCTVATRVIGHYPHRKQMLIDCGFTALTKQGENKLPGGYVIFKDHPELRLVEMTQEIGKVEACEGFELNFEQFPVGTMLRMYPYHSCATANQHSCYVVHEREVVQDIWKPVKGW